MRNLGKRGWVEPRSRSVSHRKKTNISELFVWMLGFAIALPNLPIWLLKSANPTATDLAKVNTRGLCQNLVKVER